MSYLVLHVRPYDFTADDGKQVRGSSVTYLDLGGPSEPGELGHAPLTMSVPDEVARDFREAPALYDLDFRQRRGKGGRPTLTLAGARLVAPVQLADSRNEKNLPK